MSKAHVV